MSSNRGSLSLDYHFSNFMDIALNKEIDELVGSKVLTPEIFSRVKIGCVCFINIGATVRGD